MKKLWGRSLSVILSLLIVFASVVPAFAEVRVPEDPEEIAEDAVRAGSVVWVEEKHGSRSTEIQRAAEVFEAAGTKVIGVLVV